MLTSPIPNVLLAQHSGKLADKQSWSCRGHDRDAEYVRALRPVKAKGLKNLGDGLLDYIEGANQKYGSSLLSYLLQTSSCSQSQE